MLFKRPYFIPYTKWTNDKKTFRTVDCIHCTSMQCFAWIDAGISKNNTPPPPHFPCTFISSYEYYEYIIKKYLRISRRTYTEEHTCTGEVHVLVT
jgi:hypothetical protein